MEKEGEWKMDERLALKYEIREMGKIVNFIGQKNIDVSKIMEDLIDSDILSHQQILKKICNIYVCIMMHRKCDLGDLPCLKEEK